MPFDVSTVRLAPVSIVLLGLLASSTLGACGRRAALAPGAPDGATSVPAGDAAEGRGGANTDVANADAAETEDASTDDARADEAAIDASVA
ncbi:MAG: hypothetical protein JWM82_1751, partial [Myxococcales bacterium]|nr:hypothetical protein [Myxococcales bacterium]